MPSATDTAGEFATNFKGLYEHQGARVVCRKCDWAMLPNVAKDHPCHMAWLKEHVPQGTPQAPPPAAPSTHGGVWTSEDGRVAQNAWTGTQTAPPPPPPPPPAPHTWGTQPSAPQAPKERKVSKEGTIRRILMDAGIKGGRITAKRNRKGNVVVTVRI